MKDDLEKNVRIVRYGYGEKLPINSKKRIKKNRDTNWGIQLDDSIIGDSLHYATIEGDKGNRKQIRQLLGRIDEIAENAILFETSISNSNKLNKKGSTSFMHCLYAPITINDAPFLAKLIVEECDIDNKKRGYNVQRIKLSALQAAQFLKMTKSVDIGSSGSDYISVAELYKLVKQYDKEFHPGKAVAPELLDDNGNPKVF